MIFSKILMIISKFLELIGEWASIKGTRLLMIWRCRKSTET